MHQMVHMCGFAGRSFLGLGSLLTGAKVRFLSLYDNMRGHEGDYARACVTLLARASLVLEVFSTEPR